MVLGITPGRAQLQILSLPDRICSLHQRPVLRTSPQRPQKVAAAPYGHSTRPCLRCSAKKRQQRLAEEDDLRETEAVAGASAQDDLAAELAEAEEAASMCTTQVIKH